MNGSAQHCGPAHETQGPGNSLKPKRQCCANAVLPWHLAAETVFDMDATPDTLTESCPFEDMPSGSSYHGRDDLQTDSSGYQGLSQECRYIASRTI